MGGNPGVIGLEKTVYRAMERPDVEAIVPSSATRVLDVGCGAGTLGAALKRRRPGVHVTGIDMSPALAEEATARLDLVLLGTVEEHLHDLPDNSFDCVIFADVLEHMIDPHRVLLDVRRTLDRDRGVVVASIPNVRHWSVLRELVVRGRWGYAERGLLDSGHLRFFTLASILTMFHWAGYAVEVTGSVDAAPRSIWWANRALAGKLRPFIAYQYLLSARPLPNFTRPDEPWWTSGRPL
ncbi:MAG: hypothetical protein NVS4B2_35330 [Chloroflexota bacterium]